MLGYFKLLTIIQASHDWQRTEPKMQVGQKTENVPVFSSAGYVGLFCQYLYIKAGLFFFFFFCSNWNLRWQPCWFTCYQEHKKVGLRMLALFLSLIQTTGHKMAALMFCVTFKCWFVTTRKRNQAKKNLLFFTNFIAADTDSEASLVQLPFICPAILCIFRALEWSSHCQTGWATLAPFITVNQHSWISHVLTGKASPIQVLTNNWKTLNTTNTSCW